MDLAVSFAQLLLVAVFAIAGIVKLLDRGTFEETVVAFGVPRRLASTVSFAVPLLELAVAAALIAAPTARAGAVGALVLLGLFSAAVTRALRLGSAPDCNCFGGITQTEVGRGTLLRNLALACVAAFVVVGGRPAGAFGGLPPTAAEDRPLLGVMAAALVALGWFCWALLRQNGRLLRRLDEYTGAGPQASIEGRPSPLLGGMPAPEFEAVDLAGAPVSLGSLLSRGLPTGLFFTDPGCGACELVLDTVAAAQEARAGELTLVVLSAGSIDRIKQKATDFGLARVVPIGGEELLDAYGIQGFPAFVEIGPDGAVAMPAAFGADPVRRAILRDRPGAVAPAPTGVVPG
jgi:hypothetical protein